MGLSFVENDSDSQTPIYDLKLEQLLRIYNTNLEYEIKTSRNVTCISNIFYIHFRTPPSPSPCPCCPWRDFSPSGSLPPPPPPPPPHPWRLASPSTSCSHWLPWTIRGRTSWRRLLENCCWDVSSLRFVVNDCLFVCMSGGTKEVQYNMPVLIMKLSHALHISAVPVSREQFSGWI